MTLTITRNISARSDDVGHSLEEKRRVVTPESAVRFCLTDLLKPWYNKTRRLDTGCKLRWRSNRLLTDRTGFDSLTTHMNEKSLIGSIVLVEDSNVHVALVTAKDDLWDLWYAELPNGVKLAYTTKEIKWLHRRLKKWMKVGPLEERSPR